MRTEPLKKAAFENYSKPSADDCFKNTMTIFVTAAAGFIGANFVLDWLAQSDESVVNLDKLSYAGDLETLASQNGDARHISVQGDIGDGDHLVRAYHHTYGLPVLTTNCARPRRFCSF